MGDHAAFRRPTEARSLKQARSRPRRHPGARLATDGGLMDASNVRGRARRRSGSGLSASDIPVDDAKMRTFIADMYAAMSLLRLLRQEIASVLSLSSAEYSVLLAVRYLGRGEVWSL